MRRQRPAREKEHFERADDALQIARLDARGRRRVDAAQHAVQRRNAAPPGNRLEAPAQGGVATRSGKQAARERAIVEPGPAHDHRQPAATVNVANGRRRVACVVGRRVLLGRLGDVDEMMGDAPPPGHRHLVGADVEAAEHGRRVAIDDLAVVPLGDGERQRTLAGRGGPENREDEGSGHDSARTGRRPGLLQAHEHVNDEREQKDEEAELLRPGQGGVSL